MNFAAGSLAGTASVAAADGGTWNMNTAGVAFNVAASGALANYTNAAAAIGVVTGDAGDTGYYVQEITAGAVGVSGVYNVYQVTLGTSKTAAALNAGDTIALVATVTAEAASNDFTAANFSFQG